MNITASFTKFNNQWAIRVPVSAAKVGAKVTIVKRSGESKEATITRVIKTFDDNAVCDFREAVAPKRGYRTRRPATGWSRYRSTYRTSACPICGEEEGDMYNNGHCDECGYHA